MLLRDVKELLDAKVYCGEEYLDREVNSACGADLMSDVLAFVKQEGLLLTGLLNPQIVRTAEMMDIYCIMIVRGKTPDETIVNLARAKGIVLMTTECHMYDACGKLYRAGLGR
ncbi:MAG: DRTGG domain-containing protein [Oscillospiraceae bacterium]|nr:DRTGG domain-containing protein [Oscillospiraceae bacterium]